MLNLSCLEFIDTLGSKASVPGGGSASALAGALGMALGTMAGELTAGKEKFAQHEQKLEQLLKTSKELTEELKQAVDDDIKAFEPLAQAYKLPSSTNEEKALRQETIQRSLKEAAEAPMNLAELCVKALQILDEYSRIENRLVISDVGTGAALCKAALQGANLNVITNLRLMKNEDIKSELENRLNKAVSKGNELADSIYSRVEALCR
ncbi:MAG: cyclodeaminase/cyclohydrolase family protein [Firmicutes bacterium]|nr:cyclodeaminase/cyclohydrolase family protein [Bacillota bacterium]